MTNDPKMSQNQLEDDLLDEVTGGVINPELKAAELSELSELSEHSEFGDPAAGK